MATRSNSMCPLVLKIEGNLNSLGTIPANINQIEIISKEEAELIFDEKYTLGVLKGFID